MLLLQVCKYALNRLFPLFVNVSVRFRVPQMIGFFQIMRPDMAADPFRAILAFRTLFQERTLTANFRIGPVDAITFLGRRFVAQHCVVRANVAIVILVVDVFVLTSEKRLSTRVCRHGLTPYLEANQNTFKKLYSRE